MKNTHIIIFLLVLIFTACADKRTGPNGDDNEGGFVIPFEPGDGIGWPPESLLRVFRVEDWKEPEGLTGITYTAYSNVRIDRIVANVDILKIDFNGATLQSLGQIREYLDQIANRLEQYDPWNAPVHYGRLYNARNGVLYNFDYKIEIAEEGYIQLSRETSDSYRFRWLNSEELSFFKINDLSMPPGLTNVYQTILPHRNGIVHEIIVTSDSAINTAILLHNYFYSRVPLYTTHWGYSAYSGFSNIINNTVYDYFFNLTPSRNTGWISFSRYEIDLLPGSGTEWLQIDQLAPFNLGDWTEPIGLEGLSWEVKMIAIRTIILDINFTKATEGSFMAITNYFDTIAIGGIVLHSFGLATGIYGMSDEYYNYTFTFDFLLSYGGFIKLERRDRCFCPMCLQGNIVNKMEPKIMI